MQHGLGRGWGQRSRADCQVVGEVPSQKDAVADNLGNCPAKSAIRWVSRDSMDFEGDRTVDPEVAGSSPVRVASPPKFFWTVATATKGQW